jgi:hypothetical protein
MQIIYVLSIDTGKNLAGDFPQQEYRGEQTICFCEQRRTLASRPLNAYLSQLHYTFGYTKCFNRKDLRHPQFVHEI